MSEYKDSPSNQFIGWMAAFGFLLIHGSLALWSLPLAFLCLGICCVVAAFFAGAAQVGNKKSHEREVDRIEAAKTVAEFSNTLADFSNRYIEFKEFVNQGDFVCAKTGDRLGQKAFEKLSNDLQKTNQRLLDMGVRLAQYLTRVEANNPKTKQA